MTPQDIIADALEGIGAWSREEQQSGANFDLGLRRLKAMLKSWQIERLTIDHLVRSTFTLTANTASFTVGPTALTPDWSLARPDTITLAALVESNEETPLVPLTDEEYAVLPNKAQTGLPTAFYYQRLMPLGKFYPWPIQTTSPTIALYVPTSPLSDIAAINTAIYLPPAWEEAIVANLSVRLCPAFGITVSADLADQARKSKALIKSVNSVNVRIATEGYAQVGAVWPWRDSYRRY